MLKNRLLKLGLGCLLAGSVSLAATVLLPLSHHEARAETLEALISGIEFEPVRRFGADSQIIRFFADMPFQYRLDVLNDNQVQLTLQHARLSEDLIRTNGLLSVVTGGAVESAAFKPAPDASYQQIVLSGQGLGKRSIVIEGAIREASSSQAAGRPVLRLDPVSNSSRQVGARIDIEETLPRHGDEMKARPPAVAKQEVMQDLQRLEPLSAHSSSADERSRSEHLRAERVPGSYNAAPAEARTALPESKPSPRQASSEKSSIWGKLAFWDRQKGGKSSETLTYWPGVPENMGTPQTSSAQNADTTALMMVEPGEEASVEIEAEMRLKPPARESVASRGPSIQSVETVPGPERQGPPSVKTAARRVGGPQIVEVIGHNSPRTFQPTRTTQPSRPAEASRLSEAENLPEVMNRQAPSPPEPEEQMGTKVDASAESDRTYEPRQTMVREPRQTTVRQLPRYRGGGQPITATLAGKDAVLETRGTAGGAPTRVQNAAQRVQPASGQPVVNPTSSSPTSSSEPVSALFYQDNSRDQLEQMMAQALNDYRSGNPKAALNKLEKALAINEMDPALYAARGEILIEQSRLTEAEAAYEQAASLAPKDHLLRYGELLILNQKATQARPVLERYVRSYEETLKPPEKSRALYMLGTLYQQAGEFGFATSHLKQAAELNPESADIFYNLGLAYELQGNLSLAQSYYQKAVELSPSAQDAQHALRRVKL